jgi:Flp pilus assembly protein TadB
LWRRAGRGPSSGRPVSVERAEQGKVVGARSHHEARSLESFEHGRPAAARTRRDAGEDGTAHSLLGRTGGRWRRGAGPAARRELEAAAPEVIDVLRATVAAGINPRRALQAAADGAPPALGPVLRRAIQAAELGSGAGQALATAAGAEGLTELALAGEALDLAESTGAPPGPVLAGVAVAAADRVRTRQARMAATAQARLSARVVAAMAPAFLGVLTLTAPGEAAFLVREPLGWATLAAAMTFELLGMAWSAQIIRDPVT